MKGNLRPMDKIVHTTVKAVLTLSIVTKPWNLHSIVQNISQQCRVGYFIKVILIKKALLFNL